MSRKVVEAEKLRRTEAEQAQKIFRGIPENRLQELNKESLDRLERLNSVVRKWKCQHSKDNLNQLQGLYSTRQTDEDSTGQLNDELDAAHTGTHGPPLVAPRDQAYNKELNDEIKLHMLTIDLKNRDKWDKDQLKQQTVMALELFSKQQGLTERLAKQMSEADWVLGIEAKNRIEARRTLENASIGARQCYRELEELKTRQERTISELDQFICEINREIDALNKYTQVEFGEDRKKMQLLLEGQRLTEGNFEMLHCVEMEEMSYQMDMIKVDMARFELMDRHKILRQLRWQVGKLKLEPLTYERELLRSDIIIANFKLKNIKDDIAYMQDRYLRLVNSEDLYASEAELCM